MEPYLQLIPCDQPGCARLVVDDDYPFGEFTLAQAQGVAAVLFPQGSYVVSQVDDLTFDITRA